jgi:hypothetical protein
MCSQSPRRARGPEWNASVVPAGAPVSPSGTALPLSVPPQMPLAAAAIEIGPPAIAWAGPGRSARIAVTVELPASTTHNVAVGPYASALGPRPPDAIGRPEGLSVRRSTAWIVFVDPFSDPRTPAAERDRVGSAGRRDRCDRPHGARVDHPDIVRCRVRHPHTPVGIDRDGGRVDADSNGRVRAAVRVGDHDPFRRSDSQQRRGRSTARRRPAARRWGAHQVP